MNHQILGLKGMGSSYLQNHRQESRWCLPKFSVVFFVPTWRHTNDDQRRNPAGDRELDPPFWLCWGPTQRRAAGTNHRDARFLRFFERAWGGNYKTCDLNKMRHNHCKNMQKWDDFHTIFTLLTYIWWWGHTIASLTQNLSWPGDGRRSQAYSLEI